MTDSLAINSFHIIDFKSHILYGIPMLLQMLMYLFQQKSILDWNWFILVETAVRLDRGCENESYVAVSHHMRSYISTASLQASISYRVEAKPCCVI